MAFWSANDVEPFRKYRFTISSGGIWWWAKSVSKPSYEIETKEYQLINHKFKYPGIVTWTDIEVTIIDPYSDKEGFKSKGFMNALYENGYSLDASKIDGIKKTQDDDFSFQIQQLNAKGDPVETWTLINPFIKGIKFGDLDYSSDDLTEITLTLTYDSAKIEEI